MRIVTPEATSRLQTMAAHPVDASVSSSAGLLLLADTWSDIALTAHLWRTGHVVLGALALYAIASSTAAAHSALLTWASEARPPAFRRACASMVLI